MPSATSRTALNLELYRKVFLTRHVEETIRILYPGDEMKTPVHLSLGEEAIVAGVCQALTLEDYVFGTYRNHALYLSRGGSLGPFFGELFGKATGVAQGKAGSMHMSDPERGFLASSAIVSSVIPLAVGAGFAAKQDAKGQVSAVFFGDGATEEGVFWESLNAASVMRLPVLFVCEDNGLAIHSHIRTRQSYSIPKAARLLGLPTATSDSTDPEVIARMAARSVARIRKAGGPACLVLGYHRYLEHVGISEDYDCGYRCRDEAWRDRDPVALQRAKLALLGVSQEAITSLEDAIRVDVDRAVKAARRAPVAPESALLEGVYA